MKFCLKVVFIYLSLCASHSIFAAESVNDSEITAALKQHLVVGKTTLNECKVLFGKPVSVVENLHATVYAFKQSSVVRGLQLKGLNSEIKNSSGSSLSSNLAKAPAQEKVKSEESSAAQMALPTGKNKLQGNLKSEKESVDRIINFVFKDNKLVSYKISSSH